MPLLVARFKGGRHAENQVTAHDTAEERTAEHIARGDGIGRRIASPSGVTCRDAMAMAVHGSSVR